MKTLILSLIAAGVGYAAVAGYVYLCPPLPL
jgi:hypothetical protein